MLYFPRWRFETVACARKIEMPIFLGFGKYLKILGLFMIAFVCNSKILINQYCYYIEVSNFAYIYIRSFCDFEKTRWRRTEFLFVKLKYCLKKSARIVESISGIFATFSMRRKWSSTTSIFALRACAVIIFLCCCSLVNSFMCSNQSSLYLQVITSRRKKRKLVDV